MTSNRHREMIFVSDRVRALIPALTGIFDTLDAQTARTVRTLEEAQRDDPHKYLFRGIAEGFAAVSAARRAVAELREVVDRTGKTINELERHDRSVQWNPSSVTASSSWQVCYADGVEEFPQRTDYIDTDDYGSDPPPDSDLLENLFSLELPWWLDAGLSFLVIGDLLDILREQLLKRLKGQEPDNLITAIALLGLLADLGHINPLPFAEDTPNVVLAILKPLVKRLPKGKTREYLAQLIERAVQNPDDRKFLVDLMMSLKEHNDILEKLVKNPKVDPKVMMAVLQGGSEFVELLAKHGDDAYRAAAILGKHAPEILKQYDEISHIPGADRLLKRLVQGDKQTEGAVGQIRYLRSIKDDIKEIEVSLPNGGIPDAILKDGTIIEVKNWDFSKPSYQQSKDLVVDKLLDQLERYRITFPDKPIVVVFTSPLDEIPKYIREAIEEAGFVVKGME